MSTQTISMPLRRPIMSSKPNLTPAELQEVKRQILALRRLSKLSGFNTLRTVVELLGQLTPADLIAVGEELNLKRGEMPQHTSERKTF